MVSVGRGQTLIEFRILGSLEAVESGRLLTLGTPQQRSLLAVLLLHRGEVVSSDRLIDELWGEDPPASAVKIVQGYVSNLRKVLGEGMLVTRGRGYVLQAEPAQLDVDRFETLAAEGRAALREGDARTATVRLSRALDLWRGPPLADFAYESFAQSEIVRLEELRLAATEDRVDAQLMLGNHGAQVGELESLVRLHPRRERLVGQLMLALYRCGRHADALELYRRTREALSEELGLEPGPELRKLEQQVLNHDTGLEPPDVTRPTAPAHERPRSALRPALILTVGALALLVAAIAASIVELAAGNGTSLRVAPNTVAAIEMHTNKVVGQVPVGARPSAISYGAGSLWVANVDDQTVSRIDPATLQTLRTIPVSDPPNGIAIAGGTVWVVGSSPSSTYVSASRIDSQFDTIGSTVRLGDLVPGSPVAVAAQGETLWVAPYSGELTRLDPQTGSVVQQLDPNGAPQGLGLGAGAVWVTDNDADNVTRIDPTGLVSSVAVGHSPDGIAVGDGGVWVADTGDDAIVRIDPNTQAVTTTIPVGSAPLGVAIGGGSVWVANSGDGTVTRIDPNTNRATATIPVGGSPQAITIAGGRAWVTVDAGTLSTPALAGRGGTARVDTYYDVDYMDPAVAYGQLSWQLLYATCAKLLNYPDKPGLAGAQLVPEVAQSLPTPSPDGKSYTFTIRQGFRFSPPSNAPVTAETFKYTIERTLNPRTRNPVGAEFDDIVGASAYMAGRAAHIAGVIAFGNKLTVRLTAPAPDLLSRLAQPFFCAVPSDTPINPQGVRLIPSAGPYQVASYAPGQGIVLTRNPNYHGNRPHRLARIDVAVNIPGQRAVARVEAGAADYAAGGEVDSSDATTLAARYGAGSRAARSGHQQYFVSPESSLILLALNTHRPLFSSVRLRQAVNYAIDRSALARLGHEDSLLPDTPFDDYLPPGVPGFRKLHLYPLTPDLTKAIALAGGYRGATAVLYTCDQPPCAQQAQIIKTDLAAIGLGLEVKAFPDNILYTKIRTPGEPFDITTVGWFPDYPDPDAILNLLLETGTVLPTLDDPTYQSRLASAAQLSGPRRYLTYARLDVDLARNAAPWVVFGNSSSHELFSARMGCQTYGVYSLDFAALCVKRQ